MNSLKHIMKLDLRSLALVRVTLGILTFFDLLRRIPEIGAFFSDGGILPRSVLIENLEYNYRMSLLNLNGSYSFALMLAIVGLIASVMFTIGWRTRIANFFVWIVIISFQARFPEAATTGGDMLIRIFLFWSFFLPMNAYYSVDRAVTETKHEGKEYFSIFTSAWIVQVTLLYIMTFFYKWAPVYHTEFNAVYFILNLDFMTTDFGKWLSHFPLTMKALSIASWGLEGLGPLLLFIPYKRDLFRGGAVFAFLSFHIGIGSTLHLGNFVPICLIIWLAIMPTAWWDYIEAKLKASSESIKILYLDSENTFARKLALVFKELFFLKRLTIVPATADRKAERLIKANEPFVVEAGGEYQTGFKALESALKASSLPFIRAIGKLPLAKLDETPVAPEESFGAQLVEAREKGELSLASAAKSPDEIPAPREKNRNLESFLRHIGIDKIRYKITYVEKVFGTFILALVTLWNVEGLVQPKSWYIGSPFDEIMFTFQLNQGWAMFAPHPQRSDGWFVMDGNLLSGKKWDALNNKEVTFETPENWHETYATDNWKKLLDNIQATRDEFHLQWLGKYLCRSWNNEHFDNEQLKTFDLYFMQQFTNGPDEPPAEINKIRLWRHECF
ncbi:hypothetical protein [Peredibacter starrii]|uniref:HTTM-like domain-containing protein n=1 Tax=Peredibacter starrii TaxID=28202 RepID=A0AAX4HN39_9BACT|nr:hypothetical protein [Peredibacter starrii]WPU64563.1 hypothetical protein SOO65_17865 [Peredibacter starrii]